MSNYQNLTHKQKLDRKMWITKGARFIASKRLAKKHELSSYTIAILSFYILILPFVEKVLVTPMKQSLYDSITMIMSIFILVLSVFEAGKNYQSKSENLLRCAKEIDVLYDKLQFFYEPNDMQAIKDISKEYQDILSSFTENHETIDDIAFRNRHKDDFGIGFIQSFVNKVEILKDFSFYYALIFGFPLIIFYFH